MELKKLQQYGGFALMLGGLLLAIYVLFFNLLLPTESMESDFSNLVLSPSWIPVCVIALVAVIALIFGFIAAYSKLYATAGALGLAGFIALMTAYLFQAGQLILEIFFYPAIAATENGIELFRQGVLINHSAAQAFAILFVILIAAGVLLFGVTVLRSKVFSMISGIFFMIGAILYAVSPVFILSLTGIIIFAAGCFLIGLKVRSGS